MRILINNIKTFMYYMYTTHYILIYTNIIFTSKRYLSWGNRKLSSYNFGLNSFESFIFSNIKFSHLFINFV